MRISWCSCTALINWGWGSSRQALPFSIRTRKSEKPREDSACSDRSTCSSCSAVIEVPVGMRVARQAYAGLSHVNNPASLERLRMSALVSPHSRRGERTSSSSSARIPGRSSVRSEALVPSRSRG